MKVTTTTNPRVIIACGEHEKVFGLSSVILIMQKIQIRGALNG
jgi:hypothetical protein